MIRSHSSRSRLGGPATNASTASALFCALILTAALSGGSARYDAGQLLFLEPAACLFLGLAWINLRDARGLGPLLLLLAAISAWLILQLVPLPYSFWTRLPGRSAMTALATSLDDRSFRPLSIAPYRTLNALAMMPLAFAVVLTTSLLKRRAVTFALFAAIAVAVANGTLALAQYLAPAAPLFPYHVTNSGVSVGLFANRNHAAVYTAIAMILATGWLCSGRQPPTARIVGGATLAFLMLVNAVNGSRAGVLATGIALIASTIMLIMAARENARLRFERRRFPAAIAIAAGATALWLLAGVLALSGRVTALSRLIDNSPLDDSRFDIFRTLRVMMAAYWPTGSGIGSFEQAYYAHENLNLLGSSYLNMAHNDVAQLIIEGGAAGLAFAAAFFVLGVRLLVRLRRFDLLPASLAWGVGSSVSILLLASCVDYPLRTPLFQVSVLMFLTAGELSSHSRTQDSRPTANGHDQFERSTYHNA